MLRHPPKSISILKRPPGPCRWRTPPVSRIKGGAHHGNPQGRAAPRPELEGTAGASDVRDANLQRLCPDALLPRADPELLRAPVEVLMEYLYACDRLKLIMETLTISLAQDRLLKLKEMALRLGVAPEELARATIEELLKQPDEAFQRSALDVLQKNAELYKRLA